MTYNILLKKSYQLNSNERHFFRLLIGSDIEQNCHKWGTFWRDIKHLKNLYIKVKSLSNFRNLQKTSNKQNKYSSTGPLFNVSLTLTLFNLEFKHYMRVQCLGWAFLEEGAC